MQVKTVLQSQGCVSCISYNDGIILISQLDVGKGTFYNYLFKLIPKTPSRKEELQEFLRQRDVPFASQSNVKELRDKAKEYIRCYQKRDGVLMCIEGVTAMNFYAPDLVYQNKYFLECNRGGFLKMQGLRHRGKYSERVSFSSRRTLFSWKCILSQQCAILL